MIPDGLKPGWKNMKGGGSKTPVAEAVGLFSGWKTEVSNFGGNNVVLSFTNCQMLKLDAPYPYPDWDLSIKFSESINSGWGIIGTSLAEGLGLELDMLDIDLLRGRWCHMLREDNHSFGTNKTVNPPQAMLGSVWRLVRFVQPGESVVSVAPVMAPTPVATPAPAQAIAAPVAVATPAPVVAAGELSTDPQTRALQLLHGKDLSAFFQAAIPDPIIRQDGSLVQTITSNAYVPAQVAAGKAIQNADGTYSVVGM
tara:strand:+ start:8073 stop:8834 length:762 start_codon:yes stop_codon:yes gene_type:complete